MSLVPRTHTVAPRNLTPPLASTWYMSHAYDAHTCTRRWSTQHVPCKSCFEPSIMWVLGIEPGSQAWQQALCYPLSHLASPSSVFNECMHVSAYVEAAGSVRSWFGVWRCRLTSSRHLTISLLLQFSVIPGLLTIAYPPIHVLKHASLFLVEQPSLIYKLYKHNSE